MNMHPLVVHFPIALLTLYSFLELGAHFVIVLRRQPWFAVRAFLLFSGVLGALAAFITGGTTADSVSATNPRAYIIDVHDPFAAAMTILYSILAAAYTVRAFDRKGWGNHLAGMINPFLRIWNVKKYLTHLILDTRLLLVIVFCALIDLVITGALGAAITYGPTVNPLVSFVYHLFWP